MIDLDAIEEKWLKLCGACDAGLPMSCICPDRDFRPDMLRLVQAVRAHWDTILLQARDIDAQASELRRNLGIIQRQRLTIAEQGERINNLRDEIRHLKDLHEPEDKIW